MITLKSIMNRGLVMTVISACVCLFIVAPSLASPSEDLLAGFDDYVLEVMEEWKVPGTTVAVVFNGETLLKTGYGYRDAEHTLPVTGETLFPIGSSTKAMTAALTMSLVEEGSLDLDQPVRHYLPTFALEDMDRANLVTAKDLLSHRTGLPRFDMTFMFNPDLSREEFLKNLRHMKPVVDFRAAFLYSNHNYTLAGMLYQALTGESWEEGIRNRIFQPLGMTGSTLTGLEFLSSPDFARGYYWENDRLLEVPYMELGFSAPAGAVNAGASDLARWLLGSLGLPGEPGASPILSELGVQVMHSPATPLLGRFNSHVSHLSYGLGWMIESYRGHYHVHHGGTVPGYSAMVSLFPEEGIGIAVVSNLNGTPLPSILANTLADRLLGLEPLDWNALNKESAEATEEILKTLSVLDSSTRKTGTSTAHPLDAYTGTFQHPLYGTFHVINDGEQLTAVYHQVDIPLEHWHFDVFTGWVDYFMPMQLAFRFVTDLYGNPDVLEADLDPFSTVNPVSFTRQPDREMPDEETLTRLSGEYLVMGTPITIQYTGEEQLVMTVPQQPDWLLDPLGGLKFRIRGLSGFEVLFTLGETGLEDDSITLIQPQGTFSGGRSVTE